MNKIILDDLELELIAFTRNTYFSNDNLGSNAYCTVIPRDVDLYNSTSIENIDVIQIYHDDELIYNLQNARAHIITLNETLVGDKIETQINLTFDMQPNL